MDKTNGKILRLLAANARMSWQEIGRKVHLSGQAVASRVQHMLDSGELAGFTTRLGKQERYLVTVFMTSLRFIDFEAFIQNNQHIEEALKTAGEGCYQLTVNFDIDHELEKFLTSLLTYGTYRVHRIVRQVK
jgi:Lrp/AsnC family leucine-responsive transcriptional regulator